MPSARSIAPDITIYLPSAPRWHSAKHVFAECYLAGTRQTITVTAVEKWERSWQRRVRGTWQSLPSVDCGALGKDLFAECPLVGTRQTKAAPTVTVVCGWVRCTWRYLPSVNWPALDKVCLCRVPTGRHSAKWYSAECQLFAECMLFGTRQIVALPSARDSALGKEPGTRHTWVFR